MKVVLEQSEMYQAGQWGVIRQTNNVKNGLKDAYGAQVTQGWQYNVEGCMGECAVAKAFGMYWNASIDYLDAPDVGVIQVRTSSGENDRLILHPEDALNDIFVFVVGINGEYELRGWIVGVAGQLDRYWTDPGTGRPAFFVPQKDLYPIDTLIEKVKKTQAPFRETEYGEGSKVDDW